MHNNGTICAEKHQSDPKITVLKSKVIAADTQLVVCMNNNTFGTVSALKIQSKSHVNLRWV
jgi:hypothetical protein